VKILLSGGSGFLGSALVPALRADGHDAFRLVRRAANAPDEIAWQPQTGELPAHQLDATDAVINLSGASVGTHRWTQNYRRVLRDSRIQPTSTLARAIAGHPAAGSITFVSSSAVGYYGDTGEQAVDESAARGHGFLADLATDWESAANAAPARVVHLRTGVVLDSAGGALKPLLRLFKLGLGGRLGSGRQWMSWIALSDYLAAVRAILSNPSVSGAVNVTAPVPVRNREFTAALGRALRRRAVLPVPAPALRLALGGFADEGLLVSQRILPAALDALGFEFSYPDIDAALSALV
jgi:uncharacterized protein (TIGR01777 family)